MSFRGTYLEVEPPTRTVQTWLFEGWPPDADAVESMDLQETDGVHDDDVEAGVQRPRPAATT